jgi:hypothetical protein
MNTWARGRDFRNDARKYTLSSRKDRAGRAEVIHVSAVAAREAGRAGAKNITSENYLGTGVGPANMRRIGQRWRRKG